jgi:hypothetical protein
VKNKILENTPKIDEKILKKSSSSLDELLKKYLKIDLKKDESEVDKWIKTLDNLVDWANKENR